jgi:hypothetical protein
MRGTVPSLPSPHLRGMLLNSEQGQLNHVLGSCSLTTFQCVGPWIRFLYTVPLRIPSKVILRNTGDRSARRCQHGMRRVNRLFAKCWRKGEEESLCSQSVIFAETCWSRAEMSKQWLTGRIRLFLNRECVPRRKMVIFPLPYKWMKCETICPCKLRTCACRSSPFANEENAKHLRNGIRVYREGTWFLTVPIGRMKLSLPLNSIGMDKGRPVIYPLHA